ncbi:hypothetical protein [Streptomyces sp. NPDC094049]|uniref:hypothetical protein n=1 Tax=Streptomyces sp. NPDC094049 TaxID=3154987 RepID=UPI00332ED31F
MSAQWQNDKYGPLIGHLSDLRRRRKYLGTRRGPGRCRSCRGSRRVVVVDGEFQVVYSAPCLGCEGNGTTENASTTA